MKLLNSALSFVFNFLVISGFASILSTACADDARPAVTDPHSIELLGTVRIAGDARDDSGQNQKLEDGSPANLFGGLSGMEYSGSGDRFWLLADRGAGDGAVNFPCRYHVADLTLDPNSDVIRFDLVKTHLLCAPEGRSYLGSLTAADNDFKVSHSSKSEAYEFDHSPKFGALDPEGIRRLSDGTMLVSEEYGPRLAIFEPSGKIHHQLHVPEHFRVHSTFAHYGNSGSVCNRGLEGIAVTPSEQRVVSVPQSPLVQDGRIEDSKCLGLNCRWLVFDRKENDFEPSREVIYQLDSESTGVSEVLAASESLFLVLERDGKAGAEAQHKRIYLADMSDATDVRNHPSLPAADLIPSVVAVRKHLLLDLQDDRFGIGGKLTPEKPEGMCWGKTLADGRRTLWVCCDNDFDSTKQSIIFAFAVPDSALAAF